MCIHLAFVGFAMAAALLATALFFEEGDRILDWFYTRRKKMDVTTAIPGASQTLPAPTQVLIPVQEHKPMRVTLPQVLAHIATITIATLATAYYNKPTQPPAQTPAPAVVAPQATPVAPSMPIAAAPTPAPGVVKVDTLRIEAGKIELVGNVTVTIPEIKVPAAPSVIVENKLPQALIDALTKPAPAPVVNVSNMVDPTKLAMPTIKTATVVPDPTTDGELLPPPKDAKPMPTIDTAPVRVQPIERK